MNIQSNVYTHIVVGVLILVAFIGCLHLILSRQSRSVYSSYELSERNYIKSIKWYTQTIKNYKTNSSTPTLLIRNYYEQLMAFHISNQLARIFYAEQMNVLDDTKGYTSIGFSMYVNQYQYPELDCSLTDRHEALLLLSINRIVCIQLTESNAIEINNIQLPIVDP